jgi:curli biogenesis system outer membrane secretion channel CsgG
MRKLLILLLVLVVGCASASEPSLKPIPDLSFQKRHIIAVMDFENKSGNPENDIMLNGLSDSVVDELLKYGRFRIVERKRFDDILSEYKFEATGFVDDRYVRQIGKHLGVDALLFGSLNSVTHSEKKNHGGLAYTINRKTEVVLSARLVSVDTSEILSSSTVAAHISQNESVALIFARSGNMTDEETAIRSALNIAIKQLVNDVAYRTPAKN